MLILALITSSLLATPVMSRAQVPLAHPNLKVVAIPLVFNPVAKARASETTVTVTPQVAGTLDLAVVDRRGTLVTQLTTVGWKTGAGWRIRDPRATDRGERCD